MPENLVSNPKLFADDTSLFSVIRNKHLSAQHLNEDLNKINHWVFSKKWVLILIPVNMYALKYTLNLFLKCICIYFLGQKYTWSRLSKLTNLHSKLEVYFFELMHFFQTHKYTWGGLSKFLYLYSNSEVYVKQTF